MGVSMQRLRHTVLFAIPAAVMLLTAPARAQDSVAAPAITKSQLAGAWTATIIGKTGCGWETKYVTFTLNAAGTGSAKAVSHTEMCGDSTSTNPIIIRTINSTGSGTGNLSCGTNCGWELKIQVGQSANLFSFVDVAPENPGNFIQGVAIRR
ncbi:MAG: hypothetical protein U1E66_03255 [Rhodospirillales bacterium]